MKRSIGMLIAMFIIVAMLVGCAPAAPAAPAEPAAPAAPAEPAAPAAPAEPAAPKQLVVGFVSAYFNDTGQVYKTILLLSDQSFADRH